MSWKDRAKPAPAIEAAAAPVVASWRDRAKPAPGKVAPPAGAAAPLEGTALSRTVDGLLEIPTDIKNFASSVGENIPIVGPLAAAAGERAGALALSQTKGIPFDDALKLIQEDNARRQAQTLEESPLAAGVAAPIAGAAMVPIPGAGIEGAKGVAARVLGNAGVSAADDLARGKPEDVATDAGATGAIQAAIEASPVLKRLANRRAAKAIIGQNKKAYKEAKKLKLLDKLGADALSEDEAGKPIVGLFSDAEAIAERAHDKKRFFGEKIGEVGDLIDSMKPGAVSGEAISEELLAAAMGLPENQITKPIIERLLVDAETYANKGPMSFKEAQDFRQTYSVSLKDDPTDIAAYKNAVNDIFKNEMEKSAATVAQEIPEIGQLAPAYKRLKGKYQVNKMAASTANNLALAHEANRFVSPSDYGVSIGSMLGASLMGQPVQAALLVAAGGGAAHRMVRTRGNAFVATNAKFLGDLLDSSPAVFGKHRAELQAARAKGSKSLMLTHDALLGSPDYRAIADRLAEQFGNVQGDTAAISDPEMVAAYRARIQDDSKLDSVQKSKLLSQVNRDGFYTIDLGKYDYSVPLDPEPAPMVDPMAAPPGMDRLIEVLRRSAAQPPA